MPDVPEVELGDEVATQHHNAFHALHLLGKEIHSGWCLVGGLMVVIAGRVAGWPSDRAERTKDADIVIDVVGDAKSLADVYRTLRQFGFAPPPEAWDEEGIARCTLVHGFVQIDLLGPDDASLDALEVGDDIRSVNIPGGRRALELAQPVRILYGEYGITEIRVPLLPGALAVKAYACLDPRTTMQARHLQDVAYLLAAATDPRSLCDELGPDLEVVRGAVGQLLVPNTSGWTYLDGDDKSRAMATIDFLR